MDMYSEFNKQYCWSLYTRLRPNEELVGGVFTLQGIRILFLTKHIQLYI